jgi:hypothetical protein
MASTDISELMPPFPTNGLPSNEVLTALLAGVVDVKRRAEIYESDAITPFDIDEWNYRLIDGSITVDSTRDERRMVDLTLNNNDRALNLNPINGFWYDKIIKCFWGIEYYNSDNVLSRWEIQVGEFMIDTISEDYFPNVTKITGRDYAKKCLVSDILNSIQFDPSTPVETIIRALAANAGVSKFRLPFTGLVFTDPVVFDPGTARWEIIKKISNGVGYEVYFTGDGYLTMRPYQDPSTSPVTWVFETGKALGTLASASLKSDDSLLKNHCVVMGTPQTSDSGLTTAAFGEARNDDPASPTNISRVGDRVDVFKSDYITDPAQAQAIAQIRLSIMMLEEYNIDFSSIIIPFIEGGDIVIIIDDKESNYVPSRYLLSNYTLPLGLGEMTGTGKRVTIVGTKRQFGVF